MTSPLRSRILLATAVPALLLALTACAGPAAAPASSSAASTPAAPAAACSGTEGVSVIVDASALGSADDASTKACVKTTTAVTAAEALTTAGITTEGTEQYGDQVICRVDGLPAADEALRSSDGTDYFETCKTMPAAFAYWSLWVKPAGGEWAYAEESASTQKLQPGDAVELLFTLNGEPAQPAA